jgi:hypothetical protein
VVRPASYVEGPFGRHAIDDHHVGAGGGAVLSRNLPTLDSAAGVAGQ